MSSGTIRHALVVDDEPSVRRILRYVIEKCGVETFEADNPETVAELLDGGHCADAVFLDVGLGRSDAVDVLKVLSARSYGGTVHLVSGRDPRIVQSIFRIARDLGIRTGAAIGKPFRRDDLVAALSPAGAPASAADDAAAPGRTELSVAFSYRPRVRLADGTLDGVLSTPATPDGSEADLAGAVAIRAVEAAVDAWRSHGPANLLYAVPIRAIDLADESFGDALRALAPAEAGWPGLVLEMRDSDRLGDCQRARRVAAQLQIQGFALGLVVEGNGGLPLAPLDSFTVVEVKAAAELVSGCGTDERRRDGLRSLERLARAFSARLVADGVASRADFDVLRDLGCDAASGPWVGGPLEPAALGAFRSPVPPAGAAGGGALDDLTAREREILEKVANGLSSKQIGRALGISHRTVEGAKSRMMAKLGCTNTAELLSRYYRSGG